MWILASSPLAKLHLDETNVVSYLAGHILKSTPGARPGHTLRSNKWHHAVHGVKQEN
jgi:hypothetical protein